MNYKRKHKYSRIGRLKCGICIGQRRHFGENPKYKKLNKTVLNDIRQEIAGQDSLVSA